MMAVADVYDAQRSERPYKGAMGHAAACDIIHAGAGRHFDPEVVAAFTACADQLDLAFGEALAAESTQPAG